ncbi:hypothetical protein BD289DRAFT_482574 [Coniella lustricola]|uniref:Uncharacterized protein n=1 Tax=Coniella lustricola TaxID=2025994 RepID=A0A2T3A8B7_9PEZI|nr:hypothetical protein BD289DRAFT_482574 [Coniella lustricola]
MKSFTALDASLVLVLVAAGRSLAQSASSSTTTEPTATSTSATSTVSIPASCTAAVPASLQMTGFEWFNSTHNLDCSNPNYPAGSIVCWNTTTVCSPDDTTGCACTPYCYTGLAAPAYQPLGYGPPDTINITIDGETCYKQDPVGFRDYEIGEGHFDCGSAADQIGFYGDSNSDTGNIGTVYWNAIYSLGVGTCNGQVPRYEGSFPLDCTRDAGGNATCTAPVPITLPFVGWE